MVCPWSYGIETRQVAGLDLALEAGRRDVPVTVLVGAAVHLGHRRFGRVDGPVVPKRDNALLAKRAASRESCLGPTCPESGPRQHVTAAWARPDRLPDDRSWHGSQLEMPGYVGLELGAHCDPGLLVVEQRQLAAAFL